MTNGEQKKNEKDLLNTWKEIAAYLGCDAKTCQRWEKQRALPIRRFSGQKSGRAYAYRSELDAWLRRERGEGPESGIPAYKKPSSRPMLFLLLIALPLLTAAFFIFSPPRQPEDFRIEGDTLVILNSGGKEIWRRKTGMPTLQDDGYFRKNFRHRVINRDTERPHLPYLVIEDIDGDGKNEVLLSPHTQDFIGSGRLDCFDSRGRLKWSVETGLERIYGGNRYSADYIIYGILVENLDDGREKEIVITSGHYRYFPSRLMVLGHDGTVRGDYWHSGRIGDMLIRDLDGDGHPEILATGINNEYRKGFFLVFDGRSVGGSSPQIQDYYRNEGHAEGTEKAYLLLPRTEADIQMETVESVLFMDILKNGRISLKTQVSRLDFEFDETLKPVAVKTSHHFDKLQASAVREGKIPGAMTAEEVNALTREILFWNGKGFEKR